MSKALEHNIKVLAEQFGRIEDSLEVVKADLEAFSKRLKQSESAIREFSVEIGSLNAQIATVRAKTAVTAREDKKKEGMFQELNPEEVIKALLKGQKIEVVDIHADTSKS